MAAYKYRCTCVRMQCVSMHMFVCMYTCTRECVCKEIRGVCVMCMNVSFAFACVCVCVRVQMTVYVCVYIYVCVRV